MFLDSVFIKFGDGWIKLLGESDKFGGKNTKTLTVPPIDLQYVLGKGQSESVAKTDLDDTSVDFIYSYFLQISGYLHRTLSGPYSPTYLRCL